MYCLTHISQITHNSHMFLSQILQDLVIAFFYSKKRRKDFLYLEWYKKHAVEMEVNFDEKNQNA